MLFVSIIIILVGLVIGSFLNCLAWRFHKKDTIGGRSRCPKCSAKIHWYDNLPILSFIILRARCRSCHQKISWQYPLVELITAGLFFFSFYYHTGYLVNNLDVLRDIHFVVTILRDWFLLSSLTMIFIMDLRWYIIVDKVSLPAAAIVLILNLWLGMPWPGLLLSAIIGAGFFLLQFIVSGGKWIGGGDIRLGLLMGLALGWPHILVALFLAYFLGAIVGLGLMLAGKKKFGSKLPFGTFLTIATAITMFYGQELMNFYFNLLNF